MWPRPLMDLTFAHPYLPQLGFAVSVDAAARLGRPLPAIALTSVFPPGSFYQDHPVSDDVKVSRARAAYAQPACFGAVIERAWGPSATRALHSRTAMCRSAGLAKCHGMFVGRTV